MRAYTEFVNKTPKQLIEESEEDIESGMLMRKRKIFHELREFKEHIESSGLAPMSIKSKITGVRSFYTFYNIQLPSLPRSSSVSPLMENRAIPTKKDIQDVIGICDPLEKALVLTGCSSGLAINEISNLQVQQFVDGYDPETEITTLHLVREKVGYEFYTFLTPEASKAVLEYINWRERTSKRNEKERIDAVMKQKIKYDNKGKATGYLFICRAIEPEYLETEDEELRKLIPETIQKIYSELNEKANISSPKGKRNLIRSHNMRRFFNSTLLANGADIFTTNYLMGHKLDGTQDAYFRADPNALREKYQNYIPYLTIQKELNVAESPEFQKLKNENEVLAREAITATVERAEIIKINNRFESYKKEIDRQLTLTKFSGQLNNFKLRQKYEPQNKDKLQIFIDNLENAIKVLQEQENIENT